MNFTRRERSASARTAPRSLAALAVICVGSPVLLACSPTATQDSVALPAGSSGTITLTNNSGSNLVPGNPSDRGVLFSGLSPVGDGETANITYKVQFPTAAASGSVTYGFNDLKYVVKLTGDGRVLCSADGSDPGDSDLAAQIAPGQSSVSLTMEVGLCKG